MADAESYDVLLEAKVQKWIKVEGASSPEHAARIALDLCAEPQEMTVQLEPTWLDATVAAEATGELSLEVRGRCARCGNGIVERDIPGQPWTYDWRGPDQEELVCHPCGKDDG